MDLFGDFIFSITMDFNTSLWFNFKKKTTNAKVFGIVLLSIFLFGTIVGITNYFKDEVYISIDVENPVKSKELISKFEDEIYLNAKNGTGQSTNLERFKKLLDSWRVEEANLDLLSNATRMYQIKDSTSAFWIYDSKEFGANLLIFLFTICTFTFHYLILWEDLVEDELNVSSNMSCNAMDCANLTPHNAGARCIFYLCEKCLLRDEDCNCVLGIPKTLEPSGTVLDWKNSGGAWNPNHLLFDVGFAAKN